MTATPSFSPLYQQIKELVLQSLHTGEWKPGALIPSEIDLANRYKVSQGTVRKAIDALTAENLLVRKQGRGTYVASHSEKTVQYRFLRLQPDQAQTDGPVTFERVFPVCKTVAASAEVAKALGMSLGAKVKHVVRVMSHQQIPRIYEEIWLPEPDFALLSKEQLDSYVGPIYGLFESTYGVRLVRAQEQIKAVLPQTAQQKYLQVGAQTPLLEVCRVSFTYNDLPMELRRAWYLTQDFHYRNELN